MEKDSCKLLQLPPNPGSIIHFVSILKEVVEDFRIYHGGINEVVVVAEEDDMVTCVKALVEAMPIGTSFRMVKRMFWEKKIKGIAYGKPDYKFLGARK